MISPAAKVARTAMSAPRRAVMSRGWPRRHASRQGLKSYWTTGTFGLCLVFVTRAAYTYADMDPLHAWKDDFRREVEEVLAARARSRKPGPTEPEEGFGGRLADLVIPPAGTYAELRESQRQLEVMRAENAELRERLGVKEAGFEREREGRERLKDGIARLALALRNEQAALAAAQEQERRAREESEAAKNMMAVQKLEADHAQARCEDWERESAARLRATREVQSRLDQALLENDGKDADIASLRARLSSAITRNQEDASAGASIAKAEREKLEAQAQAAATLERSVRAEQAFRDSVKKRSALEDALRLQTVRAVSFEREAGQRREEAARARSEEAAARSAAKEAEAAAAEAQRTVAKVKEDMREQIIAQVREEVRAQVREEVRAQVREELKAEVRSEIKAEVAAEVEGDRRAQVNRAYEEGLSAARRRVDAAEQALEASRRIEEAARIELGAFRDKLRRKMEKLAAAVYQERERSDAAVAATNESLQKALARLAAEWGRSQAVLEESRAQMRAEFEDERARLDIEINAERQSMRARWQEQAEALEKLRKEFERGRQGT